MNGVISDHTAHIYLAQDPSVATSSGAFLDSTDVLYVVKSPQKAPEEVATDGSWARYMCAVWSEMTPFIT
jgi:hypothetical protein